MKFPVRFLEVLWWTAVVVLPAGANAQSDDPIYALSVERMQDKIYNPWTQDMDTVELRTFRSEDAERTVAPVMRVSPGQTLKLRVNNNLAACSAQEVADHSCYNAVNIHTHGMWVSPSGNSDNVLISINPGSAFDYEFAVAANHPAGTFWYHPHMHGATSIQLGSGMAGALIVDGDRVPTETSPGDIDILFSDRDGRRFGEQILLFSQIQYGCYDEGGALKEPRSPDPDTPPWEQPAWTCDSGDVGTVDRWEQFGFPENFSGRLTAVNRQVHPTLDGIEAGRFERLRLIHAGLRRPVRFSVRRRATDAPALRDIPAHGHRDYIEKYCTGAPVDLFHFADDGLTRAGVRRADQVSMFPGSRLDALAYFDEPGSYCMVDDQRWRMQPDEYRLLGILEVGGAAAPVDDVAEHLATTLANAARTAIADRAIRDRVLADLSDGLGLTSFSWHKPVSDAEITGRRKATMMIEVHEDETETFSIDGKPHEHGRIDRLLKVGDVEEWELTSSLGIHPFHIHVNPFQVVSIVDTQGRDVTLEGTEAYDPDYAGMIGGWRDTLIVKRGRTITMRTRYLRYIGDFVMHCHFASHGDQGMMQNVRIELPGNQHTMNKSF